jgi:hypothetical protein
MNSSEIENKANPTIDIKVGIDLKQRHFDKYLKESLSASNLSNDISCLKQRKIIFDWSVTYYYDIGTLLWSLILFGQLKRQGCQLKLILPDIENSNEADKKKALRVWSFLKRWKFFEALNDCVDHPANMLIDEQIKWISTPSIYGHAYRIDEDGNTQQVHRIGLLEIINFAIKRESNSVRSEDKEVKLIDYVNLCRSKIILKALSNLCGWSEDDAEKFVGKVIVECLRNASMHSTGNLILSAFNIDQKHMTFGIVDDGIGIPDTLRSAFRDNSNFNKLVEKKDSDLIIYFTQPEMILDSKLIKLAVRPGVTTTPEHAGDGLYYCKKMVLEKGGELRIRSGNACVEFNNEVGEKPTDGLVKSSCTALRVLIPVKK